MTTALTPSFYRPTLHGPSRSVSPIAWGTGALLPGWPVKDLFFFTGSQVGLIARASTTEPEDGAGFIASGLDSNSTVWLLTADGGCYAATSSSTDISGITLVVSLPYGAYTGACCTDSSIGFYVTSSSGEVYLATSAGYSLLGTFGALARSPFVYDSKLVVTLPKSGEIGVMDLSSGSVTTSSCGMDTPSFCCSVSAGLWVAGTSARFETDASLGADIGSDGIGVVFSTTTVSLVSGTDPDTTIGDTVTVSGTIVTAIYNDVTDQVLVLTSDNLYIYTVSDSALTLSQTFALTSATCAALTPDSTELLVGESSAVSVFTETLGSWSLASETLSYSASGIWVGAVGSSTEENPAVVCFSGTNVAVFLSAGNSWTESFSITAPASVVGLSGNTETVVVLSASSDLSYATALDFSTSAAGSQVSFSGEGKGITYTDSYRFVVIYASGSSYSASFLYAFSASDLVIAGSASLPNAASSVSWSGYSVWASGYQYQIGAEGSLLPISKGMTSLVAGSQVTSWVLGLQVIPSSVLVGNSNIITSVANNKVFTQPLAGGDPVEYDLSVFTGQNSGTPLNLGGLTLGSSQVFVATSASGEIAVLGEDW